MVDGYDSADASQGIPPELDDYICDYVDGSMDPSVCAVFEEFLAANPDVQAHVCRVAQTAALLREHGRCLCAPDGFDSRLKCAVESEALDGRGGFAMSAMSRFSGIVLSSSSLAIVCIGIIALTYAADSSVRSVSDTTTFGFFGGSAEVVDGVVSSTLVNDSGQHDGWGYSVTLGGHRSVEVVARQALRARSLWTNPGVSYTTSYMRHPVLDEAPVPVFFSVRTSPVSVLYP